MRVLILFLLIFMFSNEAHSFTRHFETEQAARDYANKKHSVGGCLQLIEGKKGYWLRSCR